MLNTRVFDFHNVIHPYEMRTIRYTPEQYIEKLDRCGVEKAVITAPFYLLSDYVLGNDIIAEWCRKYPDRLVPFATINPYFGDEAIQELRRRADEGFAGVGEYHADLMSLSYDSPLSMGVLEEAIDLKMPVLFHTGCNCFESSVKIAGLYPEGKFVFAHIGDSRWQDMLPAVREYPNVHLCISGVVYERGFLTEALAQVGPDRILFGSDFVYLEPAIGMSMIESAPISAEDRRKILWENACRLLGRVS
jgi:predicted TIM-barrel fold metal-dependent hydrolase